LNVAHEEIDLARPKQNHGEHGFTDEERAGFSNFVRAGFVDILRAQNPDIGELYTWWSYYGKSRERNVGWRIDYFLASGENNPHQVRAKIHPQILGSDHCPVSIEWSEKNV
jgi:exodeoxyribonuclease-3